MYFSIQNIRKEQQDLHLLIKKATERLVTLDQMEQELQAGTEHSEDVDFSIFKDMTRRLLTELWDAPKRMISQEHIREYVMLDEDADAGALRKAMYQVRKELESKNFGYEIRNIWGKGYQLIRRETLPNVTNHPQNTGKTQKKR
jgi:DNA-binding winged helix-turn-helix (wHTH) protein